MNRRHFLQRSSLAFAASFAPASAANGAAPSASSPARTDNPMKLTDLTNVFEVEEEARRVMGPRLYDYVASGVADEITVRWNIEKYRDLRLRPRALQDVT
jgi:4-hydroxymandelate oxidase